MLRMISTSLALVAVIVGLAGAQSTTSPRTGTWKLSLEKSRFAPDPGPRSQIRKDEHTRDGLTASVDGVLGSGLPIAYRYSARFHGKDYPIAGTGVPSGAETIAVKVVDEFIVESTLKKAG